MSNYVNNMNNEEIWKMLEPKMKKNGLRKKMGALYCNNTLTNGYWVYTPDDVHNAIAIAYRSGYERAMKGRPFKIGEKKKGGHWVPVDPNNLPKEGTRVRYAREHQAYKNNPEFIKLGETGTFHYSYTGTPGVKTECNLFCPWVSFATNVFCLDMWVEDDE